MFDRATLSLGTTNEISNVALMAGSSQQGKALRASVALRREYEILKEKKKINESA